MSVEGTDLRSTLGKLTEVSQPRPLTKRRIELASLAGASEMTSLTSSILKMEVLKKYNFLVLGLFLDSTF
jgi:hypothetical protein